MRPSLIASALVGTAIVGGCAGSAQNLPGPSELHDIVIASGRVMDPESGLDAVRNVGIRGGQISAVSEAPLRAKQIFDASGLVVAPGFIDLHVHWVDAENDAYRAADGVTTALELEVGTDDVDRWYSAREGKALINYGVSIGHIPARMAVMHDAGALLPSGDAAHRAATADELAQIEALVERGLRRGAVAVGLGPAYTLGATQWEIVEIFRIAARHRASCHVHIRSPAPALPGDMSGFFEALAAASLTGAPLHLAHIHSTGGTEVERELQLIAEARARGLDVTTEVYPYDRGATRIESALFDHRENEPDDWYASLLWPATGERLTRESFLRYRKQGGRVILPVSTEEHVRNAVVSPLTAIASDGGLTEGKGHPRTAGTFARVLGRYVREEKALSLMEALRKMTFLPAQRLEQRAPAFRLKGRLRVGADADVTVFNAQAVLDRATYEHPSLASSGIRFVFVSGVAVVDDGSVVTRSFPGRPVRAPLESP
ncbi:MAG TPA: amidohydrolase family protein [Anaeromyxobacteraceae bacterium]|nr:amidohydrolase family protein [Anaeromyxobacteraceae bacterium]